jgi:hypothetical protein
MDALRTLLSLYYIPNETEAERVRHVAMFIQDLADMSDDCVWWAMREWRRNNDRRPTPATLRQLCMMRRQEAVKLLPKPEPAPLPYKLADPETLEERKAILARIAAEKGLVRRAGTWTLPSEAEEAPRVPHWTETAQPNDPRYAALKTARKSAGVLA